MENLLNNDHLIHGNQIITAVDHPKRKKLLNWLAKHPKSSVTEIGTAMRMGSTECSGHLAMLRKISLLVTERAGKKVLYSIDTDYLACMNELLKKLYELGQGE